MDHLEMGGTLVNEQVAQYCVLLSHACDMTCMSRKCLYTICDYFNCICVYWACINDWVRLTVTGTQIIFLW